jgi:hypothetical protein
MYPTSAIALFCEDIREEKSGALTLIAIMPDNVSVPPPQQPSGEGEKRTRLIPRLGVYVRINFDVSADLGPITVKVTMPDGEVVHEETISDETVISAKETREKGNSIGGMIQRLQFGGLPLNQLGRITVEVSTGAQTYLAGSLNFLPESAANP